MTDEQREELNTKLNPLFWECLDNPPIGDCANLLEGEDPDEHECPWCDTMPLEVEAFDRAVFWLREREALSFAETAEFVNSRGKDLLNRLGFDIEFRAEERGFHVSWNIQAVALPLPPKELGAPTGAEVAAPRGAASLLWRLMPVTEREAVLGDLDQEFTQRRERVGKWRAQMWVLSQVIVSLWPLLQRFAGKVVWALTVEGVRRVVSLVVGQEHGSNH